MQSTRETVRKQTKMIARLVRVVEMHAHKDDTGPETKSDKRDKAGAADRDDADDDANENIGKDNDVVEKPPMKRRGGMTGAAVDDMNNSFSFDVGSDTEDDSKLLKQIEASKHRHRSKRRRY